MQKIEAGAEKKKLKKIFSIKSVILDNISQDFSQIKYSIEI